MCDPLTIGGALLTVGGAAANYAAQSAVQSARNDVMGAERIRQQALDHEADALNAGARDRYNDIGQQTADKAQSLGDMFTTQPQVTGGSPVQPNDVMPASTSAATNSAIVNRDNTAKAFTTQQGKALGNLRSFGDVLGGISRDQAEDAMKVGQIGGFKQGSANVEQLELANAANAGSGLGFLGDILGGAGKVGVTAGLSGGSFGKLFGAAPKVAAAGAAGAFPVAGAAPFNTYLPLYGR